MSYLPIPSPTAAEDDKFINAEFTGTPAFEYTAISSGSLALLGAWHEADISTIGTTDAEMENSLAGATGIVLANPMPDAGELIGIAIKLSGDVDGGVGAGNDFTATVYLNGVPTLLTVTVTGGAGTENEAVATVTPIPFVAGDDITVFAKETGAAAAVRAVVTVWGRAVTVGGGGDGGGGSVTDTYANIVASTEADGVVGFPTDSLYLLRSAGAGSWAKWGPLFPFTPLVDADYSWVNIGGATITDIGGAYFLTGPAASGDNLRVRVKTIPAAPYTVTMACLPQLLFPANFIGCGFVLRQSSDGKLVTFNVVSDTGKNAGQLSIASTKWNSPTAFLAHYTLAPNNPTANPWQMGPCMWLRITDDSTNRKLSLSNDGENFFQVFIVARTDFLTPDQIGFYVNSANVSFAAGLTVLSWKEG